MNSYLETAIAVILIIVVFSVIAYVIQELIAANLEYRGKMLKNSLQQLLDGSKVSTFIVDKIYTHPQIKKLEEDLTRLPSYVPAANFALAIIDEVAKASPAISGTLYTDFRDGIVTFSGANGDLKILLENYFKTSEDLKTLQTNIETWYNEYMDRVTGWYKRNSRVTLRIIAVLIAIGFNVDLIVISKTINDSKGLKASLINTAERLVDQPETIKSLYKQSISSSIQNINNFYNPALKKAEETKDSSAIDSIKSKIQIKQNELINHYAMSRIADIETLIGKISNDELPLGWNVKGFEYFKDHKVLQLLGWFLSAAAISMGAPFWFELLIKLVNIRRAGVKPESNDSKRQ